MLRTIYPKSQKWQRLYEEMLEDCDCLLAEIDAAALDIHYLCGEARSDCQYKHLKKMRDYSETVAALYEKLVKTYDDRMTAIVLADTAKKEVKRHD